ncbi:hypothetical protein AT575_05460 [Streptococcus penaeicida]|uniref:DUF6287 domain-containing protein n=1 Tax=Streptococcus penaeicida TaxID=1765960 RepID=A0A2N8LC31_9STRE|nr:DUF6287 domain-containing protein [Streptococcus penaeicida]PND47715.1 hypothetical protein AT575_05460 [Streptococcus penaeicida]
MKKRLAIALSVLGIMLSLFFAFKMLSSNSQETEAKKEFGQTQVKKAKSIKVKASESEDKTKSSKSETTNTSQQNTSQTDQPQSQESSSQSTSPSNEAGNEKVSSAQTLLTSLQKQDYSPIAGTWKNDLGEVLIIAADGSFTRDYKQTDDTVTRAQDKIGNGYIHENCYLASITGAGLLVTPAGVKNAHIGTVYNQDSITMGQSIEADKHPFFKQ